MHAKLNREKNKEAGERETHPQKVARPREGSHGSPEAAEKLQGR